MGLLGALLGCPGSFGPYMALHFFETSLKDPFKGPLKGFARKHLGMSGALRRWPGPRGHPGSRSRRLALRRGAAPEGLQGMMRMPKHANTFTHTYVYIYIYIHVYTLAFMYICIYVYIHVYMYVRLYIYIYRNVYMHVYRSRHGLHFVLYVVSLVLV